MGRNLKFIELAFAGMLFAVLFGGNDAPDIMWYSFAAMFIVILTAIMYMTVCMRSVLKRCIKESIKAKKDFPSAIIFLVIIVSGCIIDQDGIRTVISIISFLIALVSLVVGVIGLMLIRK